MERLCPPSNPRKQELSEKPRDTSYMGHCRAKWDAWIKLKGLSREEAKLRFVKAYYEFSPSVLYRDSRGE